MTDQRSARTILVGMLGTLIVFAILQFVVPDLLAGRAAEWMAAQPDGRLPAVTLDPGYAAGR